MITVKMLIALKAKEAELEEARDAQLDQQKKKTGMACDMVESLLDWMASNDDIQPVILRKHRTLIRELRK